MNAIKQAMPNAAYAMMAYPLLVLMALFLDALIWEHWVFGKLYICTDTVFDFFDIIPPFVHPGTDDAYFVPAWRVWLVWYGLLAAALALPAPVIWFVGRKEREDAL